MATTTDLGKWMITNGGDYDPEKTYEQLTMVMYENSTYITLKQVTGVTPADDKLNYILMARGFNAAALSAVTATDTSGALGEEGASVNAQSLVDYLADAVMTKLLKKTDIATVLADATDKVPALSLVNELNNTVTQLNGNITSVSEKQNSNGIFARKGYAAFTAAVSEMLLGAYLSFSTVSYSTADSRSPVPSKTVAWWNVITFGTGNRCGQIAVYGYDVATTDGIVFIRRQHDNNVSDWVKIL